MNGYKSHYIAISKGSSDRSFGLVFAVFFIIVALLPLLHGQVVRNWAIILSTVFGVTALTVPGALAPLNRVWTKFGLLLHCFVSPMALAILFFGVFTPIGLLMRMFGKDPLHLRLEKNSVSYWIVRVPAGPTAESLKNQF